MKIKAFIILILSLALPIVSAHVDGDTDEINVTDVEFEFSKPGLLPDHPFYFLKRFTEKVRLFLTLEPQEKTELHLKFGKTRLAEANALIAKGKTEQALKAIDEYESDIEKAEEISKGIGANVSALVKTADDVLSKSIIVLELVYDKAPESAKPTIERVINNSITKRVQIKIKEEITEQEELEHLIEEEKKRQEEIREIIKGKETVCIQVITSAINPKTGQCREFSTPCDVPPGWEKVNSCIGIAPEEMPQ